MAFGKYLVASVGNNVGQGVSGSVYAKVDAVLKCNTSAAPYCIPNEMICSKIGQFLGLPVPPTGVMFSPGHPQSEYWFGSLNFNLTGNALPPVDPRRCIQELPHLSTGVLLFDLLVANSDRHVGNLSVDFSAQPVQMDVFDHSHALCGHESGNASLRFVALRKHIGISGGRFSVGGNRHCLLDCVTSDAHFEEWMDRIAALPAYFLKEICDASIPYGLSNQEAAEVCQFLTYRQSNIKQIVEKHRLEFTAIAQWSLFA